MKQTSPGTWTSPDGYCIVRQTADDGYVTWAVYMPGQLGARAVVCDLKQAKDTVEALRRSGGEIAHLHLL